jgi:tetratricopeptide (TPR) repeat protein
VSHYGHGLVAVALAMGLLVPVALPQKPPAPAPPPPSKPTQPVVPTLGSSQPTQPDVTDDLVVFLRGRIATNDGTSLPNDTMVERVCNESVRQQVYATPQGDFSMQMESKFDSFLDASGSPAPQEPVAKRRATGGIPRRDLMNCELRASAAGFRSNSISLLDLTPSGSIIDVGAIVVQRTARIKGMTLSATPYKAPANARKAYEKGLAAERNGKVAEARKYFEQALEIYPRYASAWFQLGTVLEKQNQKDSARAAFTQATTIDTRFLPPYLSLAAMAYEAGNWTEVLQYTGHIIDHDLLNHGDVGASYFLDLDELYPAEAYFYNALANYNLNKFEEAEKSALKAERVDLYTNFPQLHLLLAEIYARKKSYAGAISELKAYLELAPHAKDADQARERLAELERLNHSAPTSEKPVQN